MKLVEARAVNANDLAAMVAAGSASTQPAIRDLFERFLPEDQRVKRLGSVIDPQAILATRGDAKRGAEFFLRAKGVQCRECHQVAGQGGKVGPDLTHVGKQNSKAQLLESLLEPSKKIDPKFVGYLLETDRGQIHAGLLVEKSAERVILRNAKNELITVPTEEVELLVPQSKSFMPELLLRDMTADEVADLLAWLESLK
jgi:putative heme-binding domain-containing protein